MISITLKDGSKKEYKKNFNLKPASQITAHPPIAISIAVPRSGWAATKKTGTIRAKRGKKIYLMFDTYSDGILV